MNTAEDIDRFEAYLGDRMGADDRAALEAGLAADPDRARAFQEFRAAYDLVILAGEQALKTRLQVLHAEATDNPHGPVIPMRRWLGIAASVLLAVTAGYLYLARDNDPQELYAEHFNPYPAPDQLRSGASDTTEAWLRFSEAYAARMYDDALLILDEVSPDRMPPYVVGFYRGQCQLLKHEPDPRAAIDAFEQVLASYNDLRAMAHWYTALAALKADDIALAREHLGVLARPGMYKAEEALSILDALEDP